MPSDGDHFSRWGQHLIRRPLLTEGRNGPVPLGPYVDALHGELLAVVDQTMQPTRASISLRLDR